MSTRLHHQIYTTIMASSCTCQVGCYVLRLILHLADKPSRPRVIPSALWVRRQRCQSQPNPFGGTILAP